MWRKKKENKNRRRDTARVEGAVISNVLVTATETTTRMPLDILVPLPFTGPWDASKSIKIAALIAQDLINISSFSYQAISR